jgi:hypothetical protein
MFIHSGEPLGTFDRGTGSYPLWGAPGMFDRGPGSLPQVIKRGGRGGEVVAWIIPGISSF